MTPQEKYENDPEFHMMVDFLEHQIIKAQYSPSELREMVILACIHYESHHIKDWFITLSTDIEEAFMKLDEWRKTTDNDSLHGTGKPGP